MELYIQLKIYQIMNYIQKQKIYCKIEIEKQNINIDLEETLPNHVVQEIGNLITLSIEEGKIF
ncbi:hypothetical protein ACT7DA_16105 [Bacillus pacificus]